MSKTVTLIYGLLCYAIFLGVFVYAIGFIGGFATPTMLDGPLHGSTAVALIIDLTLLGIFALQHSVMARPAFKRWWTRIVPEAAERSTYVLASSLLLIGLFLWWRPIGGVVWQAPDVWPRMAVIALYLFGWALLLYATFLIDHFDLFGLRQVWRRRAEQPYQAPQFYTPSLYRLVRHPIYVGWLVIFWAAPLMTAAHLVFAVMTTAYMLIGIHLEERDLVNTFGETYVSYRRKTPMLIPRLWKRRDQIARRNGFSHGGGN